MVNWLDMENTKTAINTSDMNMEIKGHAIWWQSAHMIKVLKICNFLVHLILTIFDVLDFEWCIYIKMIFQPSFHVYSVCIVPYIAAITTLFEVYIKKHFKWGWSHICLQNKDRVYLLLMVYIVTTLFCFMKMLAINFVESICHFRTVHFSWYSDIWTSNLFHVHSF